MDGSGPGVLRDEAALLRAGGQPRAFRRGEAIYHQGDGADALHVVRSGHVALRAVTEAGDHLALELVGAGGIFGEAAALGSEALHVEGAVAQDDVRTLALRRPALEALRTHSPLVDRELLAVACERSRLRTTHLLDARCTPAELRILRRLLELAACFDDGGRTTVPCTQAELADMAGSSRSTANRVLRQLEDEQLLRISRSRIEILDAEELARRAG